MPRYDYDCAACDRRFEAVLGVHEDGPTVCSLCGRGPVKKAFSPPTIHFKGSGWAKKERHASTASRASRGSAADGASGDDASPSMIGAKEGSADASKPAVSKTDGSSTDAPKSDGAKVDRSASSSRTDTPKSGASTVKDGRSGSGSAAD